MKQRRPIRKEGIQARKLGDEWLLYDPEIEKVHILNTTAEYVWRLCDGNHDMAAINAKLCEAYAVHDEQQLASDLNEIMKKFDNISVLQKS